MRSEGTTPPLKMENQQLVSPSRPCSITPVGFGQEFLNKDHCDNTELAAADFYLFLPLKSALKGRPFCDAGDIIQNVTQELQRLSQNVSQEYIGHLYTRLRKCIFAQGDF